MDSENDVVNDSLECLSSHNTQDNFLSRKSDSDTPIKDSSPIKRDEINDSKLEYRGEVISSDDEADEDVVEVSSDENSEVIKPVILRQRKISDYSSFSNSFKNSPLMSSTLVNPMKDILEEINSSSSDEKVTEIKEKVPENVEVPIEEYRKQGKKVQDLLQNFLKSQKALNQINMDCLPDKGENLKIRHESLKEELDKERAIFSRMQLKNDQPLKPIGWEELQLGSVAVQPRTFGRQALETYNTQKSSIMDSLQQLHGSLNTCPDEKTFAESPRSLKVDLMPHQKRALAWILWREQQKPRGGILADDMGLGKTLTMLSVVLKNKEQEEKFGHDEENTSRKDHKFKGGTLVVCPASLVQQWDDEITKHVKKNVLSVDLYYGNKRETKAKRLAKQDIVITTYGIVKTDSDKNGPLFNIRWKRVILDEAHHIRNHKTQASEAACKLSAKNRWALTGTPVHNKELDLYALLKFLRCSPFDDLMVWKRWIDKKDTGGLQRLNTVIASLLLRRTKEQLHDNGALDCLPEKQWDLITIKFDDDEMNVYQKILLFSRALFSEFLHQRAKNNAEARGVDDHKYLNDPNSEYSKMHKLLKNHLKVGEVKQTDILVLLLRLRQICCHCSLIIGMLNPEGDLDGISEEQVEELNILEQLKNMSLSEANYASGEPNNFAQGLSSEQEIPLADAAKSILNPSNPIFVQERLSSKVKAILKCLKNVVSMGDKGVVVSQWPSLLRLIAIHLKECGIAFDQFDGSIPVHKRQEIVNKLNDPCGKTKVLLLSLKAGGVGLNLTGANHLLLADLHWNPQLELQAQDRIFRVGQKKRVHVYKFMIENSIEERVKQLQDKKLSIAEEVLTGARSSGNKLTLDDLRMLFEV